MLLGLLIALFRKLLPLRYSPEQMSVPISGIDKYRKYGLLNMGLCVLLAPLGIWACYAAFRAAVTDYVPAIAPPVIAIRAGDGFWLAPALLPGMVLGCCLATLIVRLMLGRERSAEYRMLGNRRLGYDATRGLMVLGVLTVAGSIALGYFGLHAGLYLGRDELAFTRMWSLHEERYPYDQVKALREVQDQDQGRSNFVIQVKGAADWSTEREVSHPDDDQKALLARLTGKTIVKGQGQ